MRREIVDAAWDIAREVGLTQITLRDVAARVGMQAPSLYTHFDSKMAIYDAMFGDAWTDYESTLPPLVDGLSADPRTAVHQLSRHFYDYAIADQPRYQLMNERLIPGFEPSPEAFAPSERVVAHARATVASLADVADDEFLIWFAVIGGLINQHFANDPGGTRVTAVVRRAVDMWADSVGLPLSSD
ncbi:TetR/AcrR family transcriptional regulator [Nocardioides stalactiti]|uniref:TetR/AcrR family transcriptional regulator n=1 Tax=Nocardioides stalactiti TaxID=2755356 RepID=UPI001602E441|nr:TetR/AcrR family transcriptional regulator [Nocardioides stalactiti]